MQEFRKTEIREILPEDAPALIDLWRRVFEDPEELPKAFLRLLPGMGTGAAAFVSGRLAGAAYIVTGLTVGEKRAAYLYAVAVHPEYRGLGLGKALTQAACALGKTRGADFVCTLPASGSLYGWYEERIGTRCTLYRKREDLPSRPGPEVSVLSAGEYNRRREQLLADMPHMSLSDPAAVYEKYNCQCFGGDFFAVGNGIAAAYREDDRAVVRELICPDPKDQRPYAAAVAAEMGCARLRLYSPGTKDDLPYLAAEPGVLDPGCIWNLAFD